MISTNRAGQPCARTDDDRATVVLLRAELLELTGGKEESIKFLTSQLDELRSRDERGRLLKEIGRLQIENHNEAEAGIAYEQALRLAPEDLDTRFRLALIYGSNRSLKMLAIRHYSIILQQNHLHTGALNNIGLLYGEFGINISKVEFLKKAYDQNDGHAIGNLASLYIEAGFHRDAEKILAEAPKKEADKSDRVLAARRQLKSAQKDNMDQTAALSREAEKLASYVSNYEFAKRFVSNEYIGKWVEIDGSSTLDIEKVNWYYKITNSDSKAKIFSYCFSLSPITNAEFANEDKPPVGLLSMAMRGGEINVALIFGEAKVRFIRLDGAKVGAKQDYKRATN